MAVRIGRDLVCSIWLLAFLWPIASVAAPEAGADRRLKYSAEAKDPQTGTTYYREQHTVVMSGDTPRSSKTRYFGPNGDEWAVLESTMTTPRDRFTHRFEDLRTGESYGVRLDQKGVPIMFSRDTGRDPFTRRPYKSAQGAPVAVAGQGFHWLIRERILKGQMKTGDTLEFRLLIPGRFDYFSFKTVVRKERGDTVFISVKLASLFLRVLAGAEMELIYSRTTGRLLEYLGPTSLLDQSGKRIDGVKIRYKYP